MGEMVMVVLPSLASFFLAFFLVPRIICLYEEAGMVGENYQGRPVTPALGLVIPLAWLPAAAWISGSIYFFNSFNSLGRGVSGSFISEAAGQVSGHNPGPALLLSGAAILGMCLPGIIDDMVGEDTRGMRNHWRALREGQLTAGMIKAVWGIMLGVLVVFMAFRPGEQTLIELLVALPLIPLWANGLNALDRRPGRCLKVFLAGLTFVAVAGSDIPLSWLLILPLAGICAAILPYDLQAAAMLGDGGANCLGAVLGVLAIILLPFPWQVVFLGLAVFLNYTGEVFSLTAIIDRVPFLTYLDRLGQDGHD